MLKSKAKKLVSLCLATVMVIGLSSSVFAYHGYKSWNVVLPMYRNGTDLQSDKHDLSQNGSDIRITNMGGHYTSMYFIMRRNDSSLGYPDVGSTQYCNYNGRITYVFNKDVPLNTPLILYGGCNPWNDELVISSGICYF